jgi:DNA-binding MarR family transcriptional regulator
MAAEQDEQPRQLPIGQLLGNLTRIFRAELAARGEGTDGVEGIRPAHLQIFGTIKANGSRLTDLARAADLSLSSAAELVDDLAALGYLERRTDPTDGRAKLVSLTKRGWAAMRSGREIIAGIERDWADQVGKEHFDELLSGLQSLLDSLDPMIRRNYKLPPE